MKDTPQTFIAYTWGSFAWRREHVLARTYAPKEAILPKIQDLVINRFGLGSRIFNRDRFPGRYLDELV